MHCLLVEDIFASVHPPTGAEKKATAPATSNTHSDQQLQHSTSTRRWYVGFLLVGKGKNSPVRVSFNLCCSPFLWARSPLVSNKGGKVLTLLLSCLLFEQLNREDGRRHQHTACCAWRSKEGAVEPKESSYHKQRHIRRRQEAAEWVLRQGYCCPQHSNYKTHQRPVRYVFFPKCSH